VKFTRNLKKVFMNVAGTTVEAQSLNVLPLFGELEIPLVDPLQDLLDEGAQDLLEEETLEALRPTPSRSLVSEGQYPDQSMYILDGQLNNLKERVKRLKFYLGELEDILPRKKI
jgi:hypothetical protein